MFTGLVEQIGTLRERGGGKLTVVPDRALPDPVAGESIAVNGCCLTLERVLPGGGLVFHTLAETLRRTNLGQLPLGARVDLERALRAGSPLGGHFVQGHVDAAVRLLNLERVPDGDVELTAELPKSLACEVVAKGSVALDGVSLTVAKLMSDSFAVRLIPTTLAATALASRKIGELLNLETDVLGKYVVHLSRLSSQETGRSAGITYERLHEAGFL